MICPRSKNFASLLAIPTLLNLVAGASATFVLPSVEGRSLTTGGSSFTLRSVAYSPTPIGADPSVGITTATTDPLLMRRDGPVLRTLGANAVRIYGAMVLQEDRTFAFGVTHEWLREAAKHNIWVIMGTFIPPLLDFSDSTIRQFVVDAHMAMVEEFGSEPNVLMWVPGNEVNATASNPDAYYTLMDEVAKSIHASQGGGAGPGFGPYVSVVDGDSGLGIAGSASLAPDVDIWAGNLFRGSHLGDLFTSVAANTTKPFWIAEFGIDSWDDLGDKEDQKTQADYLQTLWWQVERDRDIVFGGDIGFYVDEFWKGGSPSIHSLEGSAFGNAPDGFMNEEWLGLSAPIPVAGTIDDLTLKESYWRAREVWINRLSRPAPLRASFDTHLSTNYGGLVFGIYGRGDPFFSDASEVSLSRVSPGSSSQPEDKALLVSGNVRSGPDFTFFGVVIPLTTTVGQGFDFSGHANLTFDIRRGAATAHERWRVRLEDGTSTGAGDFDNLSLPLPPLTTSYQRVEIPLSDFTVGGGQLVDLSMLSQIVITADVTGPVLDSYEIDLHIDNVNITESPTSSNPPVIATIENGSIDFGDEYTVSPILTGGTGPISWALAGPSPAPSGLTVNPHTGRVAWRPADPEPALASLTIQAIGPGGADEATWTVEVNGPPALPACGKMSTGSILILTFLLGLQKGRHTGATDERALYS